MTMTLEQVRDEMRNELRTSGYVVEVSVGAFRKWADAIDAALEAQEQAVPVAWMERVVAYGIAGNIPATESTPHAFPVYAHPPAASVTDAEDATRYRWLAESEDGDLFMENAGKDALDAAIDAARAKEPQS